MKTDESDTHPQSPPLRVPVLQNSDLMAEATARRVFSNAHTYHINSISVNSDFQTYISTDDLRVNLWNLEITHQSFSFLSPLPLNPILTYPLS
ncbi:serine/threonine-protein phosphatase 2A 55 kDa regulatory subunit B beta isoform-like [Oncorhynchus kisutch]|uniref:serine/threonine-protein phosphatase 2A 55 kDa regulatory subunit B beta isoform-like n=1 Tax=Oncorhynchus kisutch TaxID=8019 RepID=UPI0012DC2BFE|nr:serine/threonine-protein phosphatase 2A 55 kDa regulatory subunit B beta isoform-like [Oncorhynchus kisutch]